MPATLVNVRLDEDRIKKVRRLRAHGISMSDVVREAIDQRFEALEATRAVTDPIAIVRAIFEKYPDPPSPRRRVTVNVHDRRSARRAILKHLKRER
jgi:hypothetical protein